MLKIVPDPPQHDRYNTHTLEDLLVQISEYLVCALTVSQQTVLLHANPPADPRCHARNRQRPHPGGSGAEPRAIPALTWRAWART